MADEEQIPMQKSEMPFITKALIIGIILIVNTVAAIGITWVLTKPNSGSGGSAAVEESNGGSPKESKELGTIYDFGDFTVNLNEPTSRYLVCSVRLEIDASKKDGLSIEKLENINVILKDKFLTVMSSKSIEDLRNDPGHKKLKKELIKEFNESIPVGEIKDIYFVKWLIQ
ncbi:MAG: flagellar basal body-associated FliL family protein [Fusobacteriota bacterium]